ncbi:MAG: homoserine dehydrogenase [Eubacteriales bacterium]
MSKVAVLGFGTVGSGVAEVLMTNGAQLENKAGEAVALKYILDNRDFPENPYTPYLIKDFAVIEADAEVNLVAECIGGTGVALDFVRRSLQAGKHVVTSNKALVAAHGTELMAIAAEKKVNFLFEASVGGGIPVLRPLTFCLGGNQMQEVCGILNGTTNFMLTKMFQENAAYDDVLALAQKLGYAEADPTADVEGIDACRKICILAALAFGVHVQENLIYTKGISQISALDVAFANKLGMSVKLLGRTYCTVEDKIVIYVAPHFIPASVPLSTVDDVNNAVMVRGNAVGEVMFYGPGAGKLPTASAVVGDLLDCALHQTQRRHFDWKAAEDGQVVPFEDVENRWFVRTAAAEGAAKMVFAGCEIVGTMDGQLGLVTAPMNKKSLDALAEQGFAILGAIPIL